MTQIASQTGLSRAALSFFSENGKSDLKTTIA